MLAGAFDIVFRLIFPLLGDIMLAAVLVVPLEESSSPGHGGGASIGGVGLVFVLGLGRSLLGAVLMPVLRLRRPASFIGQTRRRDTPALVVPGPGDVGL